MILKVAHLFFNDGRRGKILFTDYEYAPAGKKQEVDHSNFKNFKSRDFKRHISSFVIDLFRHKNIIGGFIIILEAGVQG